jgi:hypothetical protein
MARSELGRVVTGTHTNAVLGWALVTFVVLVAVGNAVAGNVPWAGFATAVAVITLAPTATLRTPLAMPPWEVLVLAVLPLLGRTFATVPVTGALAQYLSVAAMALIVAVELHTFTPVKMNYTFAVAFVVIATMAAAGVWAVVRWVPDVLLGTGFLLTPGVPEEAIEHQLMLEFVYSTLAGVLAGVVFELYFRRLGHTRERVPA